MSRFFSSRYADLSPYTPGEQPKDIPYVKLNTNESPFLPPKELGEALAKEVEKLPLYPDPECTELRALLAKRYGVQASEVFVANGSDDILNAAFMAFADPVKGVVFPDITYGFYRVYATLHHLPFREIPLCEDFLVKASDYDCQDAMVVLANPNAPTGLTLSLADVEGIVKNNRDSVVLIDEAYVDFGAESCLPLLRKYDNLLIVQTFSKSRSLAGGRLGFAIGSAELIADLSAIKYSMNPYSVNRLTLAAGRVILEHDAEIAKNCQEIIKIRENTSAELKKLGFSMTDSKANFIFAKHETLSGEYLCRALRARGVLVRHFQSKRIAEYLRISVGSEEDMQKLVSSLRAIVNENKENKECKQ